ncbi:hypothetical protein DXG03_004314, partial [Asterophora parasitica]
MAYVKNRHDFSVTLRSDIAQDLDIQVLDIEQGTFPTMTVINLYSQPRAKSSLARHSDASTHLQRLRLPRDKPVILSRDWNKHHPDWSIKNSPPSDRTRRLVEWLREQGYTLLNEKGVPTYFEHRARGSTSVLDLTFANHAALAIDATKEWTIDNKLSSRSDHHALRWVIDHGSEEIENITGTKYNLKDTDPVAWQEAFTTEIATHHDRWQSLCNLQQPRSPAELDHDVELLTEAMKAATAATAKEKRPSKKAKPWWTEALGA